MRRERSALRYIWRADASPSRRKVFGDKLKVVKIETDPNPTLVEKYAVYGLPTVMLFKAGQAGEGSKREGLSDDVLCAFT